MKNSMFKHISIIIIIILTSYASLIKDINASNGNFSIEIVSHIVEVLYNGYVFMNDTVQIRGTANDGFLIGFPYIYSQHVLRVTAHNSTDVFPVSLNVPLGNRSGFYGARVDFPQGTPSSFSVEFLFSNDLLHRESQNLTRLDLPIYPSFTKRVESCSVSILLPEGSKLVGGTVDTLTYYQENLEAFTYSPGNVTFSPLEDAMRVVDVERLERKIKLNGLGEIEGSDTYFLTNRDIIEIDSFHVVLPENASNPRVHDKVGRSLTVAKTEDGNRYNVLLRLPINIGESSIFTVNYLLPSQLYVEQKKSQSFNLEFPLYQQMDYCIVQSSVAFVLPEGGRILSFENVSPMNTYSMTHHVFQEVLTIKGQHVFSIDSFSIAITYGYNILWLAFRPTLWMLVLATVGCAIGIVWSKPKAPLPIAVPEVEAGISPEEIKSLVDTYERRRKLTPKLKTLETRAQKGKISRRRYKVQRKTLETQLTTLSRRIRDLEEKMQAAGGHHRDLIRRLEVAETEVNEVEANIRSIRMRHRRGELSLGAYRKLLSEYEQRKEKAQTTIDEILIRLREEL